MGFKAQAVYYWVVQTQYRGADVSGRKRTSLVMKLRPLDVAVDSKDSEGLDFFLFTKSVKRRVSSPTVSVLLPQKRDQRLRFSNIRFSNNGPTRGSASQPNHKVVAKCSLHENRGMNGQCRRTASRVLHYCRFCGSTFQFRVHLCFLFELLCSPACCEL